MSSVALTEERALPNGQDIDMRAPAISIASPGPRRWPPEAGGIRSSVLTLASGALGTAPLALPYAMESTGLAVGAVLLFVTAGLAALGGDVLIRCAAEQQPNEQMQPQDLAVRSWTFLLKKHFGKRAAALLDVLLMILGSGIIVMYMVFMAQFLTAFLSQVGISPGPSRNTLIIVCAIASYIPSLPSSIGAMRFMAVWIYLVLCLLAVLTSVGLVTCDHSTTKIEFVKLSPAGTLSAFCIFFFAQMYHFNLYSIFSSLQPPPPCSRNYGLEPSLADITRMRKIIRLTAMATIIVCAVTSVTGYLSWRSGTNQNIILNYKASVCGPKTMAFTLALQVMLMLNTLVSIPLNVVQTRVNIIRLISLSAGEGVEKKLLENSRFRYLLTFILLGGLAVLAMTLTAVADIISFLSGSIGTVIAFLLPFIFYKKSQVNADSPVVRFLVLLALGVSTVAGFSNASILVISKMKAS